MQNKINFLISTIIFISGYFLFASGGDSIAYTINKTPFVFKTGSITYPKNPDQSDDKSRVLSGILSEEALINLNGTFYKLLKNSGITFYSSGKIKIITLPENIVYRTSNKNYILRKNSAAEFYHSGNLACSYLTKATNIKINNKDYNAEANRICFHEKGGINLLTVAKDMELKIGERPYKIEKGSEIQFYPSGKIQKIQSLDFDFKSSANVIKLNLYTSFYESGKIQESYLANITYYKLGNQSFKLFYKIGFYESGKIKTSSFYEPQAVNTGKNPIKCASFAQGAINSDLATVAFYENGSLQQCMDTDTSEVKPFGFEAIQVGTIFFYDDKGNFQKKYSSIQTVLKQIVENGDFERLNFKIEAHDLTVFNEKELLILMNLPVAKYGKIFKTKWIAEHFQKYTWYKAEIDDAGDRLSLLEKSNMELIFNYYKDNFEKKK